MPPSSLLAALLISFGAVQTLAGNYTATQNFTDLWDSVVSSPGVITSGQIDGIDLNVVDYTKIIALPQYQQALDALAAPVDTKAFKQAEFLAYYVNAYNLLAINTIVRHFCAKDIFGQCKSLTSILDVGSIFEQVWTMPAGTLANTVVSLDDVEGALRAPRSYGFNFDEDPRIHAAIVCASVSCPNVAMRAYRPETIFEQLTENLRSFLTNPKKGLSCSGTTATASKIFSWFPDDFTKMDSSPRAATVPLFLAMFAPGTDAYCVGNATLSHFDYDWHVNSVNALPCDHNRPCFTVLSLLITLGVLLCVLLVCVVGCCCYRRRRQRRNFTRITS